MTKYKVFLELEQKEWGQFVFDHPNGNIFQTPDMYEIYKKTSKYNPILIVVKEKNDIVGLLLAVIQKEYNGLIGELSSRAIIWGGPLIKNNNKNVLDFILREYNKKVKKKVIYTQFRNIFELKELHHVFIANGFNYEGHLNIIVDISKSEENLWAEVNPKGKNKIRKALKEGTKFSVENSKEALDQCYKILKEVYSRARLPLPDYDFFFNLFNLKSQNKVILFCANYNNQIIGCRLALTYKKSIYDFYAGSLSSWYKKFPNDLIPWEVLLWGKKKGYKVFDFGGAGKPGVPYGVRDYKKKFGGELVNLGRFEKIHRPLIFRVAKTGFYFWRLIKR